MIMIEGISSEKRMKSTMSRYMDPSIADQLLSTGADMLGGKSVTATVLFSDIRGFTTLTEELGPHATVSLLNEYFKIMVECIQHEGGMLDKFIGDAIMATFGIPVGHDDDEDRAVRAAVAMIRSRAAWNITRVNEGKKPVNIGIGLNTDLVISGNIGSRKRMDFLAIGEYLAERFPQHALWPRDPKARARACNICAVMHSGFTKLRNNMGMNIEANLAGHDWNLAVQRDINRITAIWAECLSAHKQPYLFGEPTLADAFFAPVCTRFRAYLPKLPARALEFVDDVLALPAMKRWIADGLQEHEFVAKDEPFRHSRD